MMSSLKQLVKNANLRVLLSNRPYSYSRYQTGTSLQVRLMRGSLFKYKLHSTLFNDIPLHEPPLQASYSPILRIWPIGSIPSKLKLRK